MNVSDGMHIKGELLNPVFRGASEATRQHIDDMVKAGRHPDEIVAWVEQTGRAQVRDYFKNHNLRTSLGFDYAADAVGGAAGYTGQATATSSTTLTDSGATWTTNQYKGFRVVGALAATMVAGTILSNTGTVLTIDAWKVISSGVVGSTPGSTAVYSINARAHAKYIAYSTDTGAPASGDAAFTSEVNSNGITRTLGTYAHTAGTSVYTVSASMTASGNVSNVAKIYVADASGSGTGLLLNEVLLTAAGLTVTSFSSGDITVPSLQVTLS